MTTLAVGTDVGLVDHHCHGVVVGDLDRAALESYISESDWPAPGATSHFDTPLGLSILRHAAPVLDLAPGCSADAYVARRRELGAAEVARRLLGGGRFSELLVDTGYCADAITDPAALADLAGARAHTVVRIESVAEALADEAASPDAFLAELPVRLASAAATAVGFKTIVAYRYGFDLDPARPPLDEVVPALAAWLGDGRRLRRIDDPVLLRHVLWAAVDAATPRGLPLQVHAGFGDADLVLHKADPVVFTPFVRAVQPTGVPLVFLHCYPYLRQAAYLAHVYPHVYFDAGLGLHYTGASSTRLLAEAMELAPFSKHLFSSDGFGVPELHFLGASRFRRSMTAVLTRWIELGDADAEQADRIFRMVASDNARSLYRLPAEG